MMKNKKLMSIQEWRSIQPMPMTDNELEKFNKGDMNVGEKWIDEQSRRFLCRLVSTVDWDNIADNKMKKRLMKQYEDFAKRINPRNTNYIDPSSDGLSLTYYMYRPTDVILP